MTNNTDTKTAKLAKKTTASADKTEATPETAVAVTKAAKTANKTALNLFGAYVTTLRKAAEGLIAVDKAILIQMNTAGKEFVELGRDTMRAKCLNDVLDLQAAYAHARVEANAANAREIIEMTKDHAKEAYAPVKEIIDGYRNKDAAA